MIPFKIVVAMDSKRGIGKNGQLPWHLKGDLRHFKEITTATHDVNKRNVVIMGRKTWDSLPDSFQPLPGRINVVITRNEQLTFPAGVLRVNGLAQAFVFLNKNELRETIETVFIIGGAQVFEQAIHLKECQTIYFTRILNVFSCDTFFPSFMDCFYEKSVSSPQIEGQIEYLFCEYHRKS